MVVYGCYQVSTESPDGPWTPLHEYVANFAPAVGTAYEITVLKEHRLTVPADAPHIHYTLIDILDSYEVSIEYGSITIVKETIGADGVFNHDAGASVRANVMACHDRKFHRHLGSY